MHTGNVNHLTTGLFFSCRKVSDMFQGFAAKKKLKHAGEADVCSYSLAGQMNVLDADGVL